MTQGEVPTSFRSRLPAPTLDSGTSDIARRLLPFRGGFPEKVKGGERGALNGALDEFEFFEQVGSENRKFHRCLLSWVMVLSPHPGVPVSGPEHANPEIEHLSASG